MPPTLSTFTFTILAFMLISRLVLSSSSFQSPPQNSVPPAPQKVPQVIPLLQTSAAFEREIHLIPSLTRLKLVLFYSPATDKAMSKAKKGKVEDAYITEFTFTAKKYSVNSQLNSQNKDNKNKNNQEFQENEGVSDVSFYRVNCDLPKSKSLCFNEGVHKLPTFRYYSNTDFLHDHNTDINAGSDSFDGDEEDGKTWIPEVKMFDGTMHKSEYSRAFFEEFIEGELGRLDRARLRVQSNAAAYTKDCVKTTIQNIIESSTGGSDANVANEIKSLHATLISDLDKTLNLKYEAILSSLQAGNGGIINGSSVVVKDVRVCRRRIREFYMVMKEFEVVVERDGVDVDGEGGK